MCVAPLSATAFLFEFFVGWFWSEGVLLQLLLASQKR